MQIRYRPYLVGHKPLLKKIFVEDFQKCELKVSMCRYIHRDFKVMYKEPDVVLKMYLILRAMGALLLLSGWSYIKKCIQKQIISKFYIHILYL